MISMIMNVEINPEKSLWKISNVAHNHGSVIYSRSARYLIDHYRFDYQADYTKTQMADSHITFIYYGNLWPQQSVAPIMHNLKK